MKPFLNIKITDKISLGLLPDKKDRKDKKKSGCGTGFFGIILVLCIISVPVYLVKSCVSGEEKTTENTTVTVEETSEYE